MNNSTVYVPIYVFFSKHHILKFLYIYLISFLITSLFILTVSAYIATSIAEIRTDRLNLIDLTTLTDEEVCRQLYCGAIAKTIDNDIDITYVNKKFTIGNNELLILNANIKYIKDNIIYPLISVIPHPIKNDTYFILDNRLYLSKILVVYYCILVFNFFLSFLLYAVLVYYIEKTKIIDKNGDKYRIENMLQRNISESLHHEMANPLSVLRIVIRDIYWLLFRTKYDKIDNVFVKDPIVDLNKLCKVYPTKEVSKEVYSNTLTEKLLEYHDVITSSVESLFATLNIISTAKHIKYSNGSVSLKNIIENVIANINIASTKRIKVTFENLEVLNNTSVSGKLNNGDMLNVLTVLVRNSQEASATNVKFYGSLRKDGYMDLYVKDNGKGIRDSNNNIITKLDIFGYGSSTKVKDKNILSKLANAFNLTIKTELTSRGAGLALNKTLLNKCDADIVLDKTNEWGTCFKITIPVKKTEK